MFSAYYVQMCACIEPKVASLWVLPVDSASIIRVTGKVGFTPLILDALEIFEYSESSLLWPSSIRVPDCSRKGPSSS